MRAWADINNDGLLDIYVCNYNDENALFVHQGIDATTGLPSFLDQAKIRKARVQDGSHTPAFCDYDNDGDLDLFLLMNQLVSTEGTRLNTPQAYATGQKGRTFILPRFALYYAIKNREQNPENKELIVTLKDIGRPDILLQNDGQGNFVNVTKDTGIETEGIGLGVLWWDYNLDGRPDLHINNRDDEPDHLFHNNGDGTFTDVIETVFPLTSRFSSGMDAADFNADGFTDVLIAHQGPLTNLTENYAFGQVARNTLQLSSGTNTLHEAALISGLLTAGTAWSVNCGDLDNDGHPDAFMTNGHIFDMANTNLQSQVVYEEGDSHWEAYHRANAPRLNQPNRMFQNTGNLQFKEMAKAWGLEQNGVSYAANQTDFDGDGDLDMIVLNLEGPPDLYRNLSTRGNRTVVELVGPSATGSTVVLHTTAGRQAQIVSLTRGFLSAGRPLAHFGLGEADKINKLEIYWANGHHQAFEDLVANQHFTVTSPSGSTQAPPAADRSLFTPFGGVQMARHNEKDLVGPGAIANFPPHLSRLGPGFAAGDIDGDGDEDFVLGGARGFETQIVRNDGQGIYRPQRNDIIGNKDREDMGILLFDADSDNDLDLFIASGGMEVKVGHTAYNDQLLINDGAGTFTEAPKRIPALASSSSTAVAGDIDHDGDLDLFIGARLIPEDFVTIPTSYLLHNEQGTYNTNANWHITEAVSAALFSDANNDGWLDLFVVADEGPVQLYINQDGILSSEATLLLEPGPWRSINGRDIDADGDIDYVIGARGLNAWDNTAASRLLINQGDLKFETVELPRSAQLGPMNGCVFTELTGDTLPDLVILQNELGEHSEHEPLASGLGQVLINTGNATFRSLHAAESDLATTGAGKSMALTDFNSDGKPDFVLAINDDHLKAYHSHVEDVFAVRLKGKAGNTQAIGAQVRVTLENSQTQTAEVYGGEGYLSQSSGTLFFGRDNSKVTSIEIRWPDGKSTKHTYNDESTIVIDQ